MITNKTTKMLADALRILYHNTAARSPGKNEAREALAAYELEIAEPVRITLPAYIYIDKSGDVRYAIDRDEVVAALKAQGFEVSDD